MNWIDHSVGEWSDFMCSQYSVEVSHEVLWILFEVIAKGVMTTTNGVTMVVYMYSCIV